MEYESFNIPVTEVAEFFLSRVDQEVGDCITNLKLQKLVYFAQGFVLAITGRTLFDEDLVAWQHGPVVPSLYERYRNGSNPIEIPETFNMRHILNNQDILDILEDVNQVYGQYTAWKLRDFSHIDGAPWSKVNLNETLCLDDMMSYFRGLLVNNG